MQNQTHRVVSGHDYDTGLHQKRLDAPTSDSLHSLQASQTQMAFTGVTEGAKSARSITGNGNTINAHANKAAQTNGSRPCGHAKSSKFLNCPSCLPVHRESLVRETYHTPSAQSGRGQSVWRQLPTLNELEMISNKHDASKFHDRICDIHGCCVNRKLKNIWKASPEELTMMYSKNVLFMRAHDIPLNQVHVENWTWEQVRRTSRKGSLNEHPPRAP